MGVKKDIPSRQKHPLPSTDGGKRSRDADEHLDLQCPICLSEFVDAVQSSCCGTTTCRKCMLALDASKNCPFCRGRFDPGSCVRDVRMERRAANAILCCRNAGKGCAFVGDRSARIAHEEDDCEVEDRRALVKALKTQIKELTSGAETESRLLAAVRQGRRHLCSNCDSRLAAIHAFCSGDDAVLKTLHNVKVVKGHDVLDDVTGYGMYSITWCQCVERVKLRFDAVFVVENFNVAFFVRCTSHPNATAASVLLLHPSDPKRDFAVKSIVCPTINEDRVERNVMTNTSFLDFLFNKRLFVGVRF